MSQKLTFKRGPKETGLAAVGRPYPTTDIKLDKRQVGWIQPPTHGLNPEPKWRVWVHKDTENNFKNICFKAKFDDEQAARDWVTRNAEKIIALGLFGLEN